MYKLRFYARRSNMARPRRFLGAFRVSRMTNLYVTDKRHQALLFVINEILHAGAARHVARRVHAESALVMLRPKFPEPDIPTVHHLPWQRLMGNIALRLPATFVAHSWPQAQIIVVETYNTTQYRITLVTVEWLDGVRWL